jgi:hypothetical protein
MKKNEMGGTCGTRGGEKSFIEDFGREPCGKETTWNTWEEMEGLY